MNRPTLQVVVLQTIVYAVLYKLTSGCKSGGWILGTLNVDGTSIFTGWSFRGDLCEIYLYLWQIFPSSCQVVQTDY